MVYLPPLRHPRVTWGSWSVDFSARVLTMGIVNRTPDSFFDRGATYALERAVGAVLAAADAGADWVDVGGVPFSPDALDVSPAEELDRDRPVRVERRVEVDPPPGLPGPEGRTDPLRGGVAVDGGVG